MPPPEGGIQIQRIYFVRHGTTKWNVEKRYLGHEDLPLNEQGRAEAQELHRFFLPIPLRACFSSDLSRTRETAALLLTNRSVEIQADSRLRELDFGLWEGHTYSEARREYPKEMQAWIEDPVTITPPQGESLLQLQKRVSDVLKETLSLFPEGNLLVVTHGGPLRALLATILHAPLLNFWRFRLDTGCVVIIDFYNQEGILGGLYQQPLP